MLCTTTLTKHNLVKWMETIAKLSSNCRVPYCSLKNKRQSVVFQKKFHGPYLLALRGVRYEVQFHEKAAATCKTKLEMSVALFYKKKFANSVTSSVP